MDEESCSPPGIRSFRAVKALDSNIINTTKKRKLELELLDSPSPKHKYLDRGCSTPVLAPTKNGSPEMESDNLPRNESHKKRDKEGSHEESESQFESAKGSNSFTEDAESEMSVHGEASREPNYKKSDDRPSTSTGNKESAVPEDNVHSLTVCRPGGDKGKIVVGMGEGSAQCIDEESQLCETLEEHLLEFGCHLGYICSQHGNDCSEQCADEEVGKFFGLKRDNYVLSSGRWNTNEVSQSVPRKPTIDQEFEDYFSLLMM